MIYRLEADTENFMYFSIDSYEIIKKMGSFNPQNFGKPLKDIWIPPEGKFLIGDSESLVIPDISQWLPNTLILNAHANTVLSDTLQEHGEILPVVCENKEYYLYNPTHYIDDSLIDIQASKIAYADGNIFLGVKKLVFKYKLISKNTPIIFKTNFDRGLCIFCNEAFKKMYRKTNLIGLVFSKNYTPFF